MSGMRLVDNGLGTGEYRNPLPVLNELAGSLPNREFIRLRQPWLDRRGRACVTLRDLNGRMTRNDSTGGEPRPLLTAYLVNQLLMQGYPIPITSNATTLRPRDWIEMEKSVVKALRQPLVFAADLEANSAIRFNGWGKTTYEYQSMNDAGEAVVDIDPIVDGRDDQFLFINRSIPLLFTHCDYSITRRQLEISRNSDTPFDLTMANSGAYVIGVALEDQALGLVTGMTYGTQTAGVGAHTGTSTVYGATTFPQRLTKTNFTAPTAGGWVPDTTYNEILTALNQLQLQFANGPFILYYSADWDQYMNRVYSLSGGNTPGETLRTMILKNPKIQSIKMVPRLTGTYTFLFVQQAGPFQTAQMLVGLDTTTVHWEVKGGLGHRYKIMVQKVPLFRSDYNGRTGILVGTTT